MKDYYFSYSSVIKSVFGGFWNKLFIIAVFVVCFRFSDAVWGSADFQMRLQTTSLLLGSIFSLSVIFALISAILLKINPPHAKYGHPYLDGVARAAKYGFMIGGLSLTMIGILMVDGFLDPFKDLIELLLSIVS